MIEEEEEEEKEEQKDRKVVLEEVELEDKITTALQSYIAMLQSCTCGP